MCAHVHMSTLHKEEGVRSPVTGVTEIWRPRDWRYREPSSSLLQEQWLLPIIGLSLTFF